MERLRLVVLVDMPTQTRYERKLERELRELLFQDGFSCLQQGVYTRMAESRKSARAHERMLRKHCPKSGIIRLFVMTEAQFAQSSLLAGDDDQQEIEIGAQLDVFL